MDGDGQRGGSAGPSPGPRLVDATLLDHLGDGICVLDGNWSFVLVNEVAARMVGGTPVGLVGRSIWDVLPGAAGSDLERQLRRALDHQEPVDVEVHLEALDRWFSVRAVPTPGGMTVDFQDSSARHAADRALGALLAQSRRRPRRHRRRSRATGLRPAGPRSTAGRAAGHRPPRRARARRPPPSGGEGIGRVDVGACSGD